MKKGDKIWWIAPRRANDSIIETTIKSIGAKYITTEKDSRVRFNVSDLREIDATGYGSFLVTDIDAYKEKQFYYGLRSKLSRFDWELISNKDVMEISIIARLVTIVEDENVKNS
jgi:hypothetical protein